MKEDELQILQDALSKIGIPTTSREDGIFSYLFIGDHNDAKCITGPEDNFATTNLEDLFLRHGCFEFESGKLVAWQPS